MACRYLAQVASSLDSAIQDAADEAGVGNDYRNAVNQYRQGMRLNDAWETTKRIGKGMLTRTIQNAP